MDIVNNILDFAVKLVPIAGIIIAWKGLTTWRRQIKGTDKYRVATELLLEVYRVREGIGVVRTSLVQFSPIDGESATKEMNEFLGYVETMERRWKQVTEPVVQLSLLSLKAEVHLGKEIKSAIDELMTMVVELQVTYEQYIDVRRPDSGFTAADFDRDARKVLWSKPTNDDFKKSLLSSVEKIEKLASKYL